MNSRSKGKRGELEWSGYCRDEYGLEEARRGRQYAGHPEAPDVVKTWPCTHCEVKRVEKLNLEKAMAKAIEDADSGDVPYVAHRRNRGEWLVTVPADRLVQFAHMVVAQARRRAACGSK